MPTEQGQGKPRPNSDIYALGIIGIQALTKMSPMQLQTLEDPPRAYQQHLVPVSPGWRRYCQRRCATTSKTATSQQTKRCSCSKYSVATQHPRTQHGTTVESFAATSPISDTTTSQLLRITQEPQQVQGMVRLRVLALPSMVAASWKRHSGCSHCNRCVSGDLCSIPVGNLSQSHLLTTTDFTWRRQLILNSRR